MDMLYMLNYVLRFSEKLYNLLLCKYELLSALFLVFKRCLIICTCVP